MVLVKPLADKAILTRPDHDPIKPIKVGPNHIGKL
jgi:hypothetical protein